MNETTFILNLNTVQTLQFYAYLKAPSKQQPSVQTVKQQHDTASSRHSYNKLSMTKWKIKQATQKPESFKSTFTVCISKSI